jgi:formylglycine-generating enzyme required for sulfatase activity
MEFVLIPAGTFRMGSGYLVAEAAHNEKPAHRVTISQPFLLGRYPVTQTQWTAVMGHNPSLFKTAPNHPVESVSWGDAQMFLRTLNEREGNGNYRLPTEAQWEYACRAGTEAPRYHPKIDAIAWYLGNSNDQTQPVGQKLPNAWGLYDMLGNVWEWCQDGARTYTADTAVDPMGSTGDDALPVVRGGSWYDSAHGIRAACRHAVLYLRSDFLGFRCVCSAKQE